MLVFHALVSEDARRTHSTLMAMLYVDVWLLTAVAAAALHLSALFWNKYVHSAAAAAATAATLP